MGIFRLLIVAAIGWLFYTLYRRIQQQPGKNPPPAKFEGEEVVSCRVCALHIPRNEALRESGHYYCCREHRDQVDTQDS
ncbi:MAG: hypothetical protein HQL48_00805 [Gammaproteobacteria bacterium]|nr:hypothetical protein [Gammaproteobacteria bacterium]